MSEEEPTTREVQEEHKGKDQGDKDQGGSKRPRLVFYVILGFSAVFALAVAITTLVQWILEDNVNGTEIGVYLGNILIPFIGAGVIAGLLYYFWDGTHQDRSLITTIGFCVVFAITTIFSIFGLIAGNEGKPLIVTALVLSVVGIIISITGHVIAR